jgi:hypothetical protein
MGDVLAAGVTTGSAAAFQGEVLSNTAVRPATVGASAAGAAAAATGSGAVLSVGALAVTGADIVVLVTIALGLVAAGVLLLRTSRRRLDAS